MGRFRCALLTLAARVAVSFRNEFTSHAFTGPVHGFHRSQVEWEKCPATRLCFRKAASLVSSFVLCRKTHVPDRAGVASFRRVESPSAACGPAGPGPALDLWRSRFERFGDVGADAACEGQRLTMKASVLLTEDAASEAYWQLVWFYHTAMDDNTRDILRIKFEREIGVHEFLYECDAWDVASPAQITHSVNNYTDPVRLGDYSLKNSKNFDDLLKLFGDPEMEALDSY